MHGCTHVRALAVGRSDTALNEAIHQFIHLHSFSPGHAISFQLVENCMNHGDDFQLTKLSYCNFVPVVRQYSQQPRVMTPDRSQVRSVESRVRRSESRFASHETTDPLPFLSFLCLSMPFHTFPISSRLGLIAPVRSLDQVAHLFDFFRLYSCLTLERRTMDGVNSTR